jgi:hypothetical protein
MKRLQFSVVLVVAAFLTPQLTVPATAAPSPGAPARLDQVKQLVTARVDGRLAALKTCSTVLSTSASLTKEHGQQLTALIGLDTQQLTRLRARIQGATTVEAVRADDTAMVNDYRIYVLVAPKVHLTIALDTEAAAAAAMHKGYGQLQLSIANAKNAGVVTTRAERDLMELRNDLTTADSSVSGKAETLLALEAGPDAAATRRQVQAVRDETKAARASLRKAALDAKAITTDLLG